MEDILRVISTSLIQARGVDGLRDSAKDYVQVGLQGDTMALSYRVPPEHAPLIGSLFTIIIEKFPELGDRLSISLI